MFLAIKLAKKAQGMTSPNPLVGAVIIDGKGRIIGKGFHRRAGQPHAEIAALRDAGKVPAGSTMVVTLEPCNHFGKTPPCSPAIKNAGIKKVIIANRDPNPDVTGGGIKYLRRAGIEVVTDVCSEEAKKMNEDYFKHVTTKLPYVHAKIAAGLDGKIAASDGTSKWITSEQARKFAHRLRNTVDAIVVGIGTIEKDDPELTVRFVKPRQRILYRVVFDTHLSIPINARVIKNQNNMYRTMVITSSHDQALIHRLEETGVEVVCANMKEGRVSTGTALSILGKRFMSILVEGGAGMLGSFMRGHLVDKLHFFISPKIIGEDGLYPFKGLSLNNIDNAIKLRDITINTKKLKGEFFVEGYPVWM